MTLDYFLYGFAILFVWLGGWGLLEMLVDHISKGKTNRRIVAYISIFIIGILFGTIVYFTYTKKHNKNPPNELL